MKSGTKLFQNHGITNSHEGREPVGEVVQTFNRELPDGRTQAIAIGLLKGEFPDLDVCSIEADVDIAPGSESDEVIDVPDVSALALGSSKTDSPAFPGAQRLASLQFFGDDDKTDQKKEKRSMTYAEVKAGVEELGLAPHRLFSADQIREDNRLMKDLSKDSDAQVETLNTEIEKLKTEKTALEENAKTGDEAIKKVAISDGKKNLEAAIPEGTTDAQKKFLIDEFSPESENDVTAEALSTYIDTGTKRFADLVKRFGGMENPKGGGEGGKDSENAEPEDALLKAIVG